MINAEEAAGEWAEARTFEDLCAVGEQFVLGDLRSFPNTAAETLDEESLPLVGVLSLCNRAGFLTLSSQPGQLRRRNAEGQICKQRAYVCGFAQRPVAKRIQGLSLETDLYIAAYLPGRDFGYRTPVTVCAGEPVTWSGDPAFGEIEFFEEYCHPDAIEEMRKAWWVSVIDLQWGRGDHLWSLLAEEMSHKRDS